MAFYLGNKRPRDIWKLGQCSNEVGGHPFKSTTKIAGHLQTIHLDYQLTPQRNLQMSQTGVMLARKSDTGAAGFPLEKVKYSGQFSGCNGMGEEKKGESRWARALRSIKCSETVKGKESDELGDCQPAGQIPRGALLLRVNSCSHLPTNANANKGERELIQLLV